MATKVPGPGWMRETEEGLATLLHEALEALLEFTTASAGWIGLADPDGGLSFPARSGRIPEAWLTLQQGGATVWGFEVREGPTLLNELPPLPVLGEPPLHNLLSCRLLYEGRSLGHLVLANKGSGFTSHDATVLQTTAHFLAKHLARVQQAPTPQGPPAALLRLGLDCAREGVLVVDHAGNLLFANTTWEQWTGYRAEQLIGRPPPHPYWVSHRELVALSGPHPTLPQGPGRGASGRVGRQQRLGYLPFQHRNQSLFWCQVETCAAEYAGRPVTIAYLRLLPGPVPATMEPAGGAVSFQALAEGLPFAAAITDGQGRVLWANRAFSEQFIPASEILGQALVRLFTPGSAVGLERLVRHPDVAGAEGRGLLLLQRAAADGAHDWMTYWQTVSLPQGPGFLWAFAEDWESLWFADADALPKRFPGRLPGADCLTLLLRPGAPVEFWDERWERLTGLVRADLAGVSVELVLDWLFPRQLDREFVADVLNQPGRRGAQAVLEVAGQHGGQAMLCTFLPVPWAHAPAADAWLILAAAPQDPVGNDAEVQRFLRQFTRGLSHLLNNYLTVPVGLAELALDRGDLPTDLAASFSQILDSCMRAGRLIAALQDLAAEPPTERHHLSLAALVRDVLDEQATEVPAPYDLQVHLRDEDALVEVNPRMLKVVLRNLLTNAAQAVHGHERRRIDVRVYASTGDVYCEIQDTGDGLPTADWTNVLAPFFSTKGPFARDPAQRNVDALGLGLTVSQHLLALHGGRLELRSTAGEGTTAVVVLPRRGVLVDRPVTSPSQGAPLRADAAADRPGPHASRGTDSGVRGAGT
jgi:signal transduction histidine kinase